MKQLIFKFLKTSETFQKNMKEQYGDEKKAN